MRGIIDEIGGRKTLITLLVIAVGCAVDLATERGLSQNLLALLGAVLGLYTAGNVVSKFSPEAAAVGPEQETGPGTDTTAIEQHLADINAKVSAVDSGSVEAIGQMQQSLVNIQKLCATLVQLQTKQG
jgi:hypothetical protein